MVWIQKNIPPPEEVLTFEFNQFFGGLNNRVPYISIGPNQATDLLNVTFNEDGTIETRKGIVEFDPENYPALDGPVIFLDVYRPINEPEVIIRATKTSVYAGKDKIADVAGRICGVNYIGKYYFVDGDKFRVYDGENVYEIIDPPSDYTPEPAPATEGKWVYDTDGELNTAWYEPCALELEDEYKGVNVVPQKCKYIVVKRDRLYLAGNPDDPHMIYPSDINNGLYFPVALPVQIAPNGDKIKGMRAFHNAVVVGRNDDIYALYGNTNRADSIEPFVLKKVNTHTGFVSNSAITEMHNYLMFLGGDGNFYTMHTPQTDIEQLATTMRNRDVDIFKAPLNLTYDDLEGACAVFDKDLAWFSIADKILVYSYLYQSWTVFDGINARSFLRYNNDLLIGAENGKLYKYGVGYNDDGETIVSYWASKRYTLNEPSRIKQFRSINVVAHVYDEYVSEISIDVEIDYVDITDVASIKNQISRWGVSKFGDMFITRNIAQSLPIILGRRGRLIRFKFGSDKKDQPFKIYEVNGLYELRGYR